MSPRNSGKDDMPQDAPTTALVRANVTLPECLEGKIVLSGWAESLINGAKYVEPDPNYLARLLMVQMLTAETLELALSTSNTLSLQKAIPNVPDAGTGPIEITDLYVTDSDLNEGMPCYVIISAIRLETGEVVKYTTGAGAVQTAMLTFLSWGVWPIRCQITRMERKDRGGRYLFWVSPVE
jgi:hypothetical protein